MPDPSTTADAAESAAPESLKEGLEAAVALHRSGRITAALDRYDRLLKQYPGHPYALFLSGMALRDAGDTALAIQRISRAIVIDPHQARYHLMLGDLLKQSGNLRAALERLREAVRLDPGETEQRFHLGDLCMDLGLTAEARGQFHAASEINPAFTEAWINLGLCHKAEKQIQAALDCFQKAVALAPENIDAHINLGLTLLLLGDFPAGWREYEWRLQRPQNSPAAFGVPAHLPPWDGTPIPGKTLLVLGEQGFGDSLQFIRYLPAVRAMGPRILLLCPKPLQPLFARFSAIDGFVSSGAAGGECDCYGPLVSLPGLLHATVDTIPAAVPYLHPDPERLDGWSERLAGDGLAVGLVWEGKPLHQNDPLRRRSCRLADLSPLAGIPGVRYYSLQKGTPAAQLDDSPFGMAITGLGDLLHDFADTAAAMAHLDLIISIDTATAHLAGALGRRTWTLLPFAPDWRWSLEGDTTPWYPTMRLFRQTRPDHWEEPVAAMAARLQRLATDRDDPA